MVGRKRLFLMKHCHLFILRDLLTYLFNISMNNCKMMIMTGKNSKPAAANIQQRQNKRNVVSRTMAGASAIEAICTKRQQCPDSSRHWRFIFYD